MKTDRNSIYCKLKTVELITTVKYSIFNCKYVINVKM